VKISVLRCLATSALLVLLADLLAAAAPRVLIPNAMHDAATWRYTMDKPGEHWTKPEFDDSKWSEGKAGFGVTDYVTPSATIGTPWGTRDIWLRKTIDVSAPIEFTSAGMIVRHDEDVEVYVNGIMAFSAHGFNMRWTAYDVSKELRDTLRTGKNLVAVHVSQTGGGQYIDVGLVLDPEQALIMPVEPMGPVQLQKLRDARWSEEMAWTWYAEIGPIAGCNYLPRTAVNMTEMWQKETFDPKTIDEELSWAENAGYNSLRVFVQYLVWKDDPNGLKERMDEFLTISERHGMRVMFVPFCDCAFAGREPYLGKQDEPVPGVHNSGWVPSPGLKRVVDRSAWPDLERYIKDLVGRFGNDRRVLIWDLYNEPGQSALGEKSLPLVVAAFRWSREAGATQPLTVGAWVDFDSRMSKAMMAMSDVVSFHGYDTPEGIEKKSWICRQYNRPVLCTEWLHRQSGNTFETILPIFAHGQIGGYHWGLVAGRTQTYMPWGSKKGDAAPDRWQHDVMHPDGKPYKAKEFELLQNFRDDFRLRPINRRWPKKKVWQWYEQISPVVGCNFLPSTAVNSTEMWQAESFDPETIDRELGWAQQAGYNSVRVFLQYIVWKDDPEGLKRRMDQFLTIAQRHGITVMPVLFCDCAFSGKEPYLGKQDDPIPGKPNGGWVPSPGLKLVADRSAWPDLKRYVEDILGHFADDPRILIWDLYNEPGNSKLGETSLPLSEAVFQWARDAKPSQPLTMGAWVEFDFPMSRRHMQLSDVISFHGYDKPQEFEEKIRTCEQYDRPVLCTEWLMRQHGNTFGSILPILARRRVGGYHWGLVAGKTQTYLPWAFKPGDPPPEVWQHDVFHADGKPYDPEELKLIRDFRFLGGVQPTILPTSEDRAQQWFFTTDIPNYGWHLPKYDTSIPSRGIVWREGPGGFGSSETPNIVARTSWGTQNIWLRRTFQLTDADLRHPHLRIRHDEHAEIYINGQLAAKVADRNTNYQLVPLSRMARQALREGTNVVAVHCHQTTGEQCIDVGIVDVIRRDESDGPGKPEPSAAPESTGPGTPWPSKRARAWYAELPPIRGCNYVPRTAINSVEMWRKETFDPKTIDEELGWAAAAGFNSVRIFLQYVVWADDPEGFGQRLETFLCIADSHGITTMPIFFDDVCFAMKLEPILGPQDDPVYGFHNSGWVPSPGYSMVQDRQQWPALEKFVKFVVRRHGRDPRVIVWDVYNEPGPFFDSTRSFPLAKAAMGWIRSLKPMQPVTVAVWGNPQSRQFLALSDVLSLHTYTSGGLVEFLRDARKTYNRPVLCTECLARPAFGFETMLPVFADHHVGWYNWGLVAGRTETNRGWAAKKGNPRPELWYYDVLRADGTPYDAQEIELIRSFTFDGQTDRRKP